MDYQYGLKGPIFLALPEKTYKSSKKRGPTSKQNPKDPRPTRKFITLHPLIVSAANITQAMDACVGEFGGLWQIKEISLQELNAMKKPIRVFHPRRKRQQAETGVGRSLKSAARRKWNKKKKREKDNL